MLRITAQARSASRARMSTLPLYLDDVFAWLAVDAGERVRTISDSASTSITITWLCVARASRR